MKKAIGIDLGTTNSVVAFKDTAVKIIRNNENQELTRSCVARRDGEFKVGERTAFKLFKTDPINTILSIKRLMGGAFKDVMVQKMIAESKKPLGYYKFAITPLTGGTDDAVAVVLAGKQYTPEQISAEILMKLKADAEHNLGDEVTHAVITVPAYFTPKQKSATLAAAQLAGLKVQKLLAEPTAAAIAYGVDNLKAGDSRTVLVYDFGGGTFDLSILNIVDGQYMEAGTGGDRWMGGDDIDKKLQELIFDRVSKQNSISNLMSIIENLSEKKRRDFAWQVRTQTEGAKIQLSVAQTAPIFIEGILTDEIGDEIDIEVTITRDEFDAIVRPFVNRSMDLIDILLKEVGYDITMIDNILLVGGTSCIPLIKKVLSEKYGTNKIKVSEKPMLSIAEGAAILSHRMGDEYESAIDIQTGIGEISYSTNHNYYVEVSEYGKPKYKNIIEKQMPLPIEASIEVETTTQNQKIAKVSIYADVEDGKHELQALGYYLIEENLPIQSQLIFNVYLDINEKFMVKVYSKGKKDKARQIVMGDGKADNKALKQMDDLIERAVKEFKTRAGEDAFLKYVTNIIKEIEAAGSTKINDNKWHEIYYRSTEEFDKIKGTERGRSEVDNAVYQAKSLIIEFGELLDPFDKTAIFNMITGIESAMDENDKAQLASALINKIDQYTLLNAGLRIELFANRILNIPGTPVGVTSKQGDVNKLMQYSVDVKAKLKMGQIDSVVTEIEEAYAIIEKYKESL